MNALKRLDTFEPRHEGALLAYLRRAVGNRILDIIRANRRQPTRVDLPDDLAHEHTSPLDAAIGAENRERYEAALTHLDEDDRDAIILRLELHYTYDELQVALDTPTAGAARMAVRRALQRLAVAMQGHPAA